MSWGSSFKTYYDSAGWAGAALGTSALTSAQAAWRGSRATRATGYGALAGAGWGAASDDTSVLGGAAIGAGLGRYGRAGYAGATRRLSSRAQMKKAASGWGGFASVGAGMAGGGIKRQAKRDFMKMSRMGRNAGNYIGAQLTANAPVKPLGIFGAMGGGV